MSVATNTERYVRTAEVAKRLSVCTKSVRNYIQAGEFGPVLRLAQNDLRIPESGIEMFIRNRMTRA